MAINFPPPTTIGEIYTDPAISRTWKWNGKAWEGTASNAFLMDNMTEGTTTKILTDSERALIGSAIQTETNGTVQGTGATTLNIVAADEGTVAGNARGENSVDLQTTRTTAVEVASGDSSSIIGGIDNRASGGNSTVLGGQDNISSAYATLTAGRAASAGIFGARVFGDGTTTGITSRQAHEFAIQASALRLEDGNEAVGKVLTCNHADGSSNWADLPLVDAVGESVTGTATFTNSTNNIALTGIGNITGLADGDVIEVTGSVSNNDVYTVEGITDTGNVIVNAEHAGGTTSKSLTDETVAVTVTLVCKAKNAPLGYGQGWVAVTRSANSDITNSTGRLIAVGASATNSRATYVVCSGYVDGLAITNFRNDDLNNYDRELFAYFNVTDGSIYKVETIGCDLQTWSELR